MNDIKKEIFIRLCGHSYPAAILKDRPPIQEDINDKDDNKYEIAQYWVDTHAQEVYMLSSITKYGAQWKNIRKICLEMDLLESLLDNNFKFKD